MSTAEGNSSSVENNENYVEDGKNKMVLKCKFCNSKILDKKSGDYVVLETEIPLMEQDTRQKGDTQNEKVTDFYHVENMYTFDNIGFTHTVGNRKYLSCADCDVGPIGYFDIDTKHSYVALSRVKHVD